MPHGGAFGLQIDRSEAPGWAWPGVACPHLIVTASSAQAAGGWLRWGWPSARVRLARRGWRSLDSSPDSGPGCWNSDCVVRFGSHGSWHRAGPFLTHVRGRTGKPCQPATPISLPRRHFWRRCGCLPGPDHFFPAGAALRPSVSQMLRTSVQTTIVRGLGMLPSHVPPWLPVQEPLVNREQIRNLDSRLPGTPEP